jgi:hypothetical protein
MVRAVVHGDAGGVAARCYVAADVVLKSSDFHVQSNVIFTSDATFGPSNEAPGKASK